MQLSSGLYSKTRISSPWTMRVPAKDLSQNIELILTSPEPGSSRVD
jgi:hypothetical protein